MIENDVDLSVAIDILNRKIANLNMAIVDNPEDLELLKKREKILKIREEISKGNVELIKKIISDT